jgi:hypothetical protein
VRVAPLARTNELPMEMKEQLTTSPSSIQMTDLMLLTPALLIIYIHMHMCVLFPVIEGTVPREFFKLLLLILP